MAEKKPIVKYAIQVLKDAIHRLENDECDENAIAHMVEQVNAESKGYYRDEDFYNYDEAMRVLHIGKRENLQLTLRRNGIKQMRIKNKPVGFPKSQVDALAAREKRPPIKQRRKKNE